MNKRIKKKIRKRNYQKLKIREQIKGRYEALIYHEFMENWREILPEVGRLGKLHECQIDLLYNMKHYIDVEMRHYKNSSKDEGYYPICTDISIKFQCRRVNPNLAFKVLCRYGYAMMSCDEIAIWIYAYIQKMCQGCSYEYKNYLIPEGCQIIRKEWMP